MICQSGESLCLKIDRHNVETALVWRAKVIKVLPATYIVAGSSPPSGVKNVMVDYALDMTQASMSENQAGMWLKDET